MNPKPIENIIADPVTKMSGLTDIPHPQIPLPRDIYGPERMNSAGLDTADSFAMAALKAEMDAFAGDSIKRYDTKPATPEMVDTLIQKACDAKIHWAGMSVDERAACLEKAADLFEKNQAKLMTLLCLEGKSRLSTVSPKYAKPLISVVIMQCAPAKT